MASWPNFAFDLCGICCGHFLMPFWTFFGATFLGNSFFDFRILKSPDDRESLRSEHLPDPHPRCSAQVLFFLLFLPS